MKRHRIILFFTACLFAIFQAPQRVWPADAEQVNAAPADATSVDASTSKIDFYLTPLIEAAFSGNIYWRPDWPLNIPPDGFSLQKGSGLPEEIEISNGVEKYNIKKDGEGRLIEFPFFTIEGYVRVETVYADTGALQTMSASFFPYGATDAAQDNQTKEKIWYIEFPDDFIPYSDYSPGGSFPPAKISQDDNVFYVFFFESPIFFSETWYDRDGDFFSFCKALVDRKNDTGYFYPVSVCTWRIRSLQIIGPDSPYFEDYFFDSNGNITEIRLSGKSFQAVYQNKHPRYWRYLDGNQSELYWDTQGTLISIKAVGIEYHYEYGWNSSGDWTSRQESAYKTEFDLLIPTPSLSRGTWNRKIQFYEAENEETSSTGD
jgi:hypothetical protein